MRNSLEAFDKRLEALLGASGAPGGGRGGGRGGAAATTSDTLAAAVASLSALSRELGAADVQPTAQQVAAVAAARADARRVMARWRALSTTELAALNASLVKAGAAPIK